MDFYLIHSYPFQDKLCRLNRIIIQCLQSCIYVIYTHSYTDRYYIGISVYCTTFIILYVINCHIVYANVKKKTHNQNSFIYFYPKMNKGIYFGVKFIRKGSAFSRKKMKLTNLNNAILHV